MTRRIDDDAVKRRIWNIVEKWKYQGRKYDALLLESVIAQIVDTQPTLTPPNEWVSVEDEIPSDDDDGLEFFCMTNATGKCGGVLPLEWEVATIRGKTVRRWKWLNRISPWAVTHWMKRPAPPGENNNVPTKAPNKPLTLEQLREMDGEPVWVEDVKHWALIDIEKCTH